MRNLQQVFDQIQQKRSKQKDIRKMYRDTLEASGEYRDLVDKIDDLKIKKKQLESNAWSELGNRDEFETSKLDIKQDKEMLNDIALSTLMNGDTVKVVDEDNNEYEPKFSVNFIKGNVVRK